MKCDIFYKTVFISHFFLSSIVCAGSLQSCESAFRCFSITPFAGKSLKKAYNQPFFYKTFIDWKKACTQLRTRNKVVHGKLSRLLKYAQFAKSYLSKKEFNKAFKKYMYMAKKSSFAQPQYWINYKTPKKSFFTLDSAQQHCMFFAQKVIVSPDAEIAIHADLHGDIHALIQYINHLFLEQKIDNHFKITNKNFYLVFLGDYTDGWLYGVEVLYTLMRLKIANPNQVILLQGNHEDIVQNKLHGLKKEFNKKFAYTKKKRTKKISRLGLFYNLLPSVVYLGVPSKDKRFVNYVLLAHGGLEPRFNPHRLLKDKRHTVYQLLYKYDPSWFKGFNSNIYNKTVAHNSCSKKIGFMWNDFIVDSNNTKFIKKSHRRYPGLYKFSKEATKAFFQSCSCEQYAIKTMFRGHQHSHRPMYKKLFEHHGLYNLCSNTQWDGVSAMTYADDMLVWTLCATPHALKDVFFKKWPILFDIHVVLKLNQDFKKWSLQPKQLHCL